MNCNIIEAGLEGSLIVFLLTLSFKIYKMKVKTHSKCCGENGNNLEIETENSGGQGNLPI